MGRSQRDFNMKLFIYAISAVVGQNFTHDGLSGRMDGYAISDEPSCGENEIENDNGDCVLNNPCEHPHTCAYDAECIAGANHGNTLVFVTHMVMDTISVRTHKVVNQVPRMLLLVIVSSLITMSLILLLLGMILILVITKSISTQNLNKLVHGEWNSISKVMLV